MGLHRKHVFQVASPLYDASKQLEDSLASNDSKA